MSKLRLVLFVMMVSFVFVLAGCIENTSNPDAGEGEAEAETQEADTEEGEKVVNIGYSGPLSGAAAYYGERTLNGVKMAVEEINTNGGFEVDGQTYKIELNSLDDKYLPNETAANAKRLLQENDTPIIFTPHSGGVKAMQVFNEKEKFIIGAYTSEPGVTAEGNELTVRIPPRYDGYMDPFTTYAMENFGKKIAAIPTASQYGKDWTDMLMPHWEEAGGEVVYNSSVDFSKDTDFFTMVTNALENDPDVMFIGGPSEPTAKLAEQARKLGFEGGFIIMDQAKLDEMKSVTGTYETFEGAVGVLPLVDAEYPGTDQFVEKYRQKFDEDPGSEAGFNYIATHIFKEAMIAAGTVDDAEAIREHMQAGIEALPEDKQVYTVSKIEEDGGFVTGLSVAAVENGEIKSIEVDQ
ncbi:ABC transporter substrate-binding protein [Thalassobacillus sp. CUG 92003]|uniref:ABC transporter substrate-binding protein n=1 Tax=Thalassobacillus sp. CUG 92003 TaxID=2736641 RepID=UPI0015E76524|nr:ABC transporter substrate-binding protein [Thalassobacillus sp. CUG 92003]